MATKKSKKETEEAVTTLSRLEDLRRDIKGNDGLTALLDILIDNEGGDSTELEKSIVDERSAADDAPEDGSPEPEPVEV